MDRDAQLAIITSGWPPITDDDIAMLADQLPQHRGPQRAQVLWRSGRPMTSAALAVLPDGTEVFVKRHLAELVGRADLGAKHQYVNHLVAAGFPTVPQLRFVDGTTVAAHDGWWYEVSLRATGVDRYRELASWQPPATDNEALEVGRLAGRLRSAAESIPAVETAPTPYQTRVRLLLGDPAARHRGWLDARPAVASYIERAGVDFEADLAACAGSARRLGALADAPMRWTHGDLHVSNMLWRGHRVSALIDFGLASVNPPLVDLAMAIERHAIDWVGIVAGDPDGGRPRIASLIIKGYQQSWPLTGTEAELLADLVAVVQAEFALGVIEYVQHAPVPPANADWAYHNYFAAHCRWFGTAAGRRFSESIHQVATTSAKE